jgi:hypothetical protein
MVKSQAGCVQQHFPVAPFLQEQSVLLVAAMRPKAKSSTPAVFRSSLCKDATKARRHEGTPRLINWNKFFVHLGVLVTCGKKDKIATKARRH